MTFAIWILFSLFLLLCSSCTIYVKPLHARRQITHVARHKKKTTITPVPGILGTDSNGRTIVTKSWLSNYHQLESKHGRYANNASEITPADTPGLYAIGPGVREHYQEMKKKQIELKER